MSKLYYYTKYQFVSTLQGIPYEEMKSKDVNVNILNHVFGNSRVKVVESTAQGANYMINTYKLTNQEGDRQAYVSLCTEFETTGTPGATYLLTYEKTPNTERYFINAYRVDVSGVADAKILMKNNEIIVKIGDQYVLGRYPGVVVDNVTTYSFALPAKSCFLQGMHVDVLSNNFNGVLKAERENIVFFGKKENIH